MEAVFAAADISGISTGVSAIVLGLVAVSLIFVGRRYLGKSGIK